MDYGPTPAVATPQPLYARYIHGGHTVDFTPDTSDYGAGAGNGVPFGAPVVIGGMVGIAVVPIPAGVKGALVIEGVFEFVKAASDGGMAAGSLAYWNPTTNVATGTASGGTYIGKVEIAAATADVLVKVSVEAMANASGSVGFGVVTRSTVAAYGSTVSDAHALAAGFNSVTAADATKGVVLPSAPTAGTMVIVKNVANAVLKVWPDAAATINLIGSNANIAMAAYTSCIFIADSATQWYTIPYLPS